MIFLYVFIKVLIHIDKIYLDTSEARPIKLKNININS